MEKISEEEQFLDITFIDQLATSALNTLTSWANDNVYKKHGGELTWKIPLNEQVNAGAQIYLARPLNPTIIINLGMVREIYRDAFVFPIISKRIAEETSNVKQLNQAFGNMPFTYPDGMPAIPLKYCRQFLYMINKFIELNTNPKLSNNDIACRFMMFEIMLAWVFFHELAHLLQRHYLLKSPSSNHSSTMAEFYEIRSSESSNNQNIQSQAREILADIEGIDLTLKYMKMQNAFCSGSIYLVTTQRNFFKK